MKRLTALLLTLILVLSTAAALADTWFCPECGTKCDGNFCSNCGTKRPANTGTGTSSSASDLKIDKVVQNSDGSFSISWSGGKAPYSLDYMWYANADHNKGADVTLWSAEDNYYSTSTSLETDLVPGERYWLILSDADGSRIWYDYDAPNKTFSVFPSTRMVFSLRTRKNNRSATVTSFDANDIERGYLNNLYGATIKMDIGRHSTDYIFNARMVLFLPNGEPLMFYYNRDGISRRATWAYWETLDFRYAWTKLLEIKGSIPAGRYTYRLYADDELFGQESIYVN